MSTITHEMPVGDIVDKTNMRVMLDALAEKISDTYVGRSSFNTTIQDLNTRLGTLETYLENNN